MKQNAAFNLTAAALLFLGVFAGSSDSEAQNTMPMDPISPIAPKDYSECSTLQQAWSDLLSRVDKMHEDCLESHRKTKEKPNPEANASVTCSFPGCQSLHTRKSEISRRMGPAVQQCRAEVDKYLEGERRRKAEEERIRAEEARRRKAEEERIRAEDARRREEAEARKAKEREDAAERARRSKEESARRTDEESRKRNDRAAEDRERKANEETERRRAEADLRKREDYAAEARARRDREADDRRRADADARERERLDRDDRDRKAAEERRRADEEATRRAAEEAARRAAEESARRKQGAYVRDIVESGAADRETEDLTRAIEARMNKSPDLGELILAQMQKSVPETEDVFAAEARNSIESMDSMTTSPPPDTTTARDYQPIEPAPDSAFRDIFRKLSETEIGKRLTKAAEDLKQRMPDLIADKMIDRLSEAGEKDAAEGDNRITDKVYKFAVDKLWKRGIEGVPELYAQMRATRQGETTPDPIELEYFRTEAAAHPVTGLWPRILKSGGNVPKAIYSYYKNLIDKFGNLLGMAIAEP